MNYLTALILICSLLPLPALAQSVVVDSAQVNEALRVLQLKDAELQNLLENQNNIINNRIIEDKQDLVERIQVLDDELRELKESNVTNQAILNALYLLGFVGFSAFAFLGQRLMKARNSIKQLEQQIETIEQTKLDQLNEQIDRAVKSSQGFIVDAVVKKTEEASKSRKAALTETLLTSDQDHQARMKSDILVLYRPAPSDETSYKDRMEALLQKWRFPVEKIAFKEMDLKKKENNVLTKTYDVVLFDDHDKTTREEALFLHLLDAYPNQNFLLYSNYQLPLPDKYVDMSINFARSPFTLYSQLMNTLKYTHLMKEDKPV